MIEKIAELLAKLSTDARCIEAGIQEDNEDELVGKALDQILKIQCEEIEKVENPNKNAVFEGDYQNGNYQGFQDCRQKILTLLRPVERKAQSQESSTSSKE